MRVFGRIVYYLISPALCCPSFPLFVFVPASVVVLCTFALQFLLALYFVRRFFVPLLLLPTTTASLVGRSLSWRSLPPRLEDPSPPLPRAPRDMVVPFSIHQMWIGAGRDPLLGGCRWSRVVEPTLESGELATFVFSENPSGVFPVPLRGISLPWGSGLSLEGAWLSVDKSRLKQKPPVEDTYDFATKTKSSFTGASFSPDFSCGRLREFPFFESIAPKNIVEFGRKSLFRAPLDFRVL